jgi:hypothetical protein
MVMAVAAARTGHCISSVTMYSCCWPACDGAARSWWQVAVVLSQPRRGLISSCQGLILLQHVWPGSNTLCHLPTKHPWQYPPCCASST